MRTSNTKLRFLKLAGFATLALVCGLCIFFIWTTSVSKNTDDYLYDLPFKKGTSRWVVQGYGGLFSHVHTAAIDFSMPVGTEVFAAREGVVFAYKDDSDQGGIFPGYKRKANYLIIKHADGSFGCYWHLKKNGVLIKSGSVKKGQLIALSGATGFVLKPHLHFSVKRILNYDINSFVKTRFRTTAGNLFLKNWTAYESPAN
jgi:murein DD-endopeptidase MepM/ murein hydrolase activator NlpD